MILWTSKGEIGMWNLTENEELFLGKDCSVGSIHKMVVKMKEHLPICREFSIICIESTAIVNYAAYIWRRSGS